MEGAQRTPLYPVTTQSPSEFSVRLLVLCEMAFIIIPLSLGKEGTVTMDHVEDESL